MKRKLFLLCLSMLCLAGFAKAQEADMLKAVPGKYWAYENSVWDAKKNSIHTFLQKQNEQEVIMKGTGIFFDENGTFREIADPQKISGSQPCTGKWEPENKTTLRVNCGGKIWHYKVVKVKDNALLLMINK